MRKLLFTLTTLLFCLAYTAQAQTFKPEQFDGSWDVHCEHCEEDLHFTFNLVNKEGQTPAFAKHNNTYDKFTWSILGGKFLVLNIEMRSPEGVFFIRTQVFSILSVTADEIKLQAEHIMKYGDAPSLPTEKSDGPAFTLYKRKKGKLTYIASEEPAKEEYFEKK